MSRLVDPRNEMGRRNTYPDHLWWIGAALWIGAMLLRWPNGLSFGDEVGYLGQMRLLLEGRLHPFPQDPGVWVTTAHGQVAKFPYLLPLVIAPLFAIAPRLVFLPGVLAGVVLSFLASRVLRSWGRNAAWGLVILAYPPVVIIARTAMADLILALLVVGAWWAIRRDRSWLASVLIAATIATKAIGFVLVGALVLGEALRSRDRLRRGDAASMTQFVHYTVGALGGFALSMGLNLAANGTPWSVYDEAHVYLGTPSFWPRYFLTSAPAHIASLLLAPPLLVAGLRPLLRRREYGPFLIVVGLVSMMCFYFFVDRGRSFVETLIMSPRLILPAAAFLLLGYADLLAELAPRGSARSFLALPGTVLPAVLCLAISILHRRWQEPDAAALAAASAIVGQVGEPELGLTLSAIKTGALYRGRTSLILDPSPRPKIVLCNTRSASYRDPVGDYNCAIPGYDERLALGGFRILARRDSPMPH